MNTVIEKRLADVSNFLRSFANRRVLDYEAGRCGRLAGIGVLEGGALELIDQAGGPESMLMIAGSTGLKAFFLERVAKGQDFGASDTPLDGGLAVIALGVAGYAGSQGSAMGLAVASVAMTYLSAVMSRGIAVGWKGQAHSLYDDSFVTKNMPEDYQPFVRRASYATIFAGAVAMGSSLAADKLIFSDNVSNHDETPVIERQVTADELAKFAEVEGLNLEY